MTNPRFMLDFLVIHNSKEFYPINLMELRQNLDSDR